MDAASNMASFLVSMLKFQGVIVKKIVHKDEFSNVRKRDYSPPSLRLSGQAF